MVQSPASLTSPYRIVVKAREAARPKDFIWQIILHDPEKDIIMETSGQGFKTAEEADRLGSIALTRYYKA